MKETQLENYIIGFFEELPLKRKVEIAESEGLVIPQQFEDIISERYQRS